MASLKTPQNQPAFVAFIAAGTSVAVFVLLTLAQPYLRPAFARWMVRTSPLAATTTLQIPTDLSIPAAEAEDAATIRVVKRAQGAVVAVIVLSDAPQATSQMMISPFGSDPLEPFFRAEPLAPVKGKLKKRQVGGGSGFFVSEDGIVATNKHVVDLDGAEFRIVTSDGKKYPAKLLGTDPLLDLAFLKVDGGRFPTIAFGDSDALEAGQTVIAIGNALGEFQNTVTKGVVSGLNRRLIAQDGPTAEMIEEAIQIDAAINPGNSGGPLLDLHGNVIGLNTAVSDRGQSLGFALPSNTVRRDFESIKKTGKIVRPFLGVRYQMVTEDLVQLNQLPVDDGALIVRGDNRNELAIAPGSPADKAGLVENDIILEVDGKKLTEDRSLASLLGHYAPGDTIQLTVLHAGTQKTVTITLAELK